MINSFTLSSAASPHLQALHHRHNTRNRDERDRRERESRFLVCRGAFRLCLWGGRALDARASGVGYGQKEVYLLQR
jgi:hypothetical protein